MASDNGPEETPAGLHLNPFAAVLRRLRLYGEMVMFSHTLFSLPFALSSMLIAAGGFPGWYKTVWIIIAFTGGRNAANALNRLIDRDIDARNPRTADRHLPSGRLKNSDALWIAAAGIILLSVSAFMLNWLCVVLLPIAVIAFVLYSFTKRFTVLCHFFLGGACAAASFGAWIAVTGRIETGTFIIATANALWVAGFDIIYAIQDKIFDRNEGLHSIPANMGEPAARIIAAAVHAASAWLLFLIGRLNGMGLYYSIGIKVICLLFIIEHLVSLPAASRTENRFIEFAAYRMNQIIGAVFIIFSALDFFLRSWQPG